VATAEAAAEAVTVVSADMAAEKDVQESQQEIITV